MLFRSFSVVIKQINTYAFYADVAEHVAEGGRVERMVEDEGTLSIACEKGKGMLRNSILPSPSTPSGRTWVHRGRDNLSLITPFHTSDVD